MPRHPESPGPKTTTATKRAHKPSTRAAALFDRLVALDAAEADELRNAPESIKKRYAQKRFDAAGPYPPDVVNLAHSWYAAHRKTENAEAEGPVSE